MGGADRNRHYSFKHGGDHFVPKISTDIHKPLPSYLIDSKCLRIKNCQIDHTETILIV